MLKKKKKKKINTFEQIFNCYIKPIKLKPGSNIQGTIIALEKESVLVDVGLKSDAFVPIEQFKNLDGELKIKIGDKLNFILETIEDGTGLTILSREKAKKEETWSSLQTAHKEGRVVRAKVISKVKGGLSLDIEGVKGFLPGSLVDFRVNKEFLENIEGKFIDVKLLKLDDERNNVVVSRKAVLELDQIKAKKAFLAKLKIDSIITGQVKNITDYGGFIDLGNGVDGLLHITDISWKRINHPKEVISLGQILKLKLIKYDSLKNRISLGLKQLTNDPWYILKLRFPVGQTFKGKVTNILAYGCFVEIEDGVEGLVHLSEIVWLHKGLIPERLVKIGQKVDVVILFVDDIKRRISLGMKECQNNPWQNFCKNYKNGDITKARVKAITDFGIFVEFKKQKLDGLIHISDIAWERFYYRKLYNLFIKGSIIKSMILDIDIEKERIALGIKQIERSKFDIFVSKHKQGDILIGKVISYDEALYNLNLKLKDINISISLKKYMDKKHKKKYQFLNNIKYNDFLKIRIRLIDRKKKLIKVDIINRYYKIEDNNQNNTQQNLIKWININQNNYKNGKKIDKW